MVSPNFDKHFFIQCDASNVGIGAVIFKRVENDGEHPIEFFSEKLTKTQQNYTVTEKECYAVIRAVEKFRHFIDLLSFTVITDHSSLKWLMNQKDLCGRLGRWSLRIQRFSFDIIHRRGTQNVVPDLLSRLELEEISLDESAQLIDLNSDAFQSESYSSLIDTIIQNAPNLPDLLVKDKYIYKRTCFSDGIPVNEDHSWKLWIPKLLTDSIIEKVHCSDVSLHCGIGKTLFKIREYFYWPGMCIQIRKYIQNCDLCKECKPTNRILRPKHGAQVQTQRAFQKIYIDFLGPYTRSKRQNSFIFIVLDHQTKFVLLKALRKAISQSVIKFLIDEVFYKFGVPEVIHSDNGKQFISNDFKTMVDTFGIKHMKTAFHAPQANASERVNQSILAAIRTNLKNDQSDWDKNLANIECALRSSIHSSIGVTPYFALFGQNMITHASAYALARKLNVLGEGDINIIPKESKIQIIREQMKAKLDKAYDKNVKSYNKRSRDIIYREGQEVFRKNYILSDFKKGINAKLCKPWLKCRIRKAVGRSIYEIETTKGEYIGVIHAKDLK